MPIAVFKGVREVSSEDEIHSASNLLKQQPGKKWKTKTVGEKIAYVILELDQPQQITGIDIGNEHSAFVEVLVGRAGCLHDDFTEILITCSFMTPIESKNSSNPNRVRCFNQEALVSTVTPSKWQAVKVICTQPFNRHVQYGLSFIKVHLTEEATQVKKQSSGSKCIVPEKFLKQNLTHTELSKGKLKVFGVGNLMLREPSPDSESEGSSSLFNRWKKSRNSIAGDNESSVAAALPRRSIVESVSCSLSSKGCNDKEPRLLDRNREQLLFGNDDGNEDAETEGSRKYERLSQHIESDRENLRIKNEKLLKQKDTRKSVDSIHPPAKKKTDQKSSDSLQQSTSESASKRSSSPTDKTAKKRKILDTSQFQPFNELLRGVVLVISGIQNPDRTDLRSKALALGAKYKADWGPGCTHLICAFKNTPKYNQVKGKGKIITRSWIEKCYALKKYLPWRRYALDSTELAKPESDEEILDESLKPTTCEENEKSICKTPCANEDDASHSIAIYDLGDSLTEQRNIDEKHNITSGSDTEDEILRVKKDNNSLNYKNNNNKNNKTTVNKSRNSDVYEVTTEEEEFLKDKRRFTNTALTFFNQTEFYICADISVVDKIKLEQYIGKYGGCLTQNLSKAHYAVSHEALKEPKSQNFAGKTVSPLWIYECSDMETRVPITRYLV